LEDLVRPGTVLNRTRIGVFYGFANPCRERHCVADRGFGHRRLSVYDVLYRDRSNRKKVLATGVPRDRACEVARIEARRRHVGRMFLAGSEHLNGADVVLIVESGRH
jgi:hypothetical protein